MEETNEPQQLQYICNGCGKKFYVGEEVFLDPSDYNNGSFHRRCLPSGRVVVSSEQAKQLEELSFKLVFAWDDIDDYHGTQAEIDAAIQDHIKAIAEVAGLELPKEQT